VEDSRAGHLEFLIVRNNKEYKAIYGRMLEE